MIRLTIPGKPRGKGRPRTSRGVIYTPPKTREYEQFIQQMYMLQAKGQRVDGPFSVSVRAYYPIPKSASKAKRARMLSGETRPVVKPDLDNVVKIVTDALNGLAYLDDNRMVEVQAEKFYSDDPRVEVQISEWRGDFMITCKECGAKVRRDNSVLVEGKPFCCECASLWLESLYAMTEINERIKRERESHG